MRRTYSRVRSAVNIYGILCHTSIRVMYSGLQGRSGVRSSIQSRAYYHITNSHRLKDTHKYKHVHVSIHIIKVRHTYKPVDPHVHTKIQTQLHIQ